MFFLNLLVTRTRTLAPLVVNMASECTDCAKRTLTWRTLRTLSSSSNKLMLYRFAQFIAQSNANHGHSGNAWISESIQDCRLALRRSVKTVKLCWNNSFELRTLVLTMVEIAVSNGPGIAQDGPCHVCRNGSSIGVFIPQFLVVAQLELKQMANQPESRGVLFHLRVDWRRT